MSLYIREPTGSLVQVKDVTPGPDLYESEIEDLVWGNLELVAEEPLFPLRRQAVLPGGGQPDVLALDLDSRVVVVEVKRDIDRHQLAQALEYAGWAGSTNLDELAGYYDKGADAFFSDWPDFTQSSTPRVVNHSARLILVARGIHPRTRDALSFLARSGVPVAVVLVSVYEDDDGRRLFEVQRQAEIDGATMPDHGGGARPRGQTSYMYNGHAARIADLIEEKLLAPGTELAVTIGGQAGSATITDDGNIEVGDHRFSAPSSAGQAVVGHSINGWVSWKVPSQGGQSLADLRKTLLDLAAQAEEV